MNEHIEPREIILPPKVLMRCKQEAINSYTSNNPMNTVDAALTSDLERVASLFDYLWGYEFGSGTESDRDIILEATGAEIVAWCHFEDLDLDALWDLILECYECHLEFAKDIVQLHSEDC